MWHSIDNKPTEPGLYIGAKFVDNKMLAIGEYALCLDGYFGPNDSRAPIPITHWMSRKEFYELLENIPKE